MEQRRTPGAALPDSVVEEALTARAVLDEHGIVTEWSEGAGRLLGYRPNEIVGRHAGRLLDGDARAEMLRGIQAVPRWTGRVALRHRNGHRVEAGVVAHHRTQGDTAPDWFLVSPLDGAARPEDYKLVEWCFQQSPCCGMSAFDTGLRRRRANLYAERIGNITEAEQRGLRFPEISAHPSSERIEQSMLRALETGDPQRMELYLRAPGESREHAWWSFEYPLRDEDGTVRGVGHTGHDVTEQYWARKRLQLLNDAGSRIGSTLDVARTAQELTDVAVPEIADLALVDLLPDPDSPRRPGLPVAQLTHAWGTRQTDAGKTIWAEQTLDSTEPESQTHESDPVSRVVAPGRFTTSDPRSEGHGSAPRRGWRPPTGRR